MKTFESVGKGILVWLLLSLILKCSAVALDAVSAASKLSVEESVYERETNNIS